LTRKREPDIYQNSIEPPTYESASYFIDNAEHVRRAFHSNSSIAGRYGRYSNPTWIDVERRLSELSKAEASLIFSSGMAAHLTVFLTFLEAGDVMLLPVESYRQVRNLCHVILPKFGIEVHECSIADPRLFLDRISELRGRAKLVHLEMPSSPHMYLIDVDSVRKALPPEVIVTMDSSFAPPPNFYALSWGVDIVMFSATKYLGGHGDIVAGVASGRADLLERVRWYRDTTGAIADGGAATLLRRSLYTLDLRVHRVNGTAATVARHLDEAHAVSRVYYTGLESHPHRHLAERYLNGHGGVITFELGVSEERTSEFVDNLAVPYMASNFGAPQTLVEQSTLFTYFEYSDAQLETLGIDKSTVRLAIGYADDAAVIIDDIDQALSRIGI